MNKLILYVRQNGRSPTGDFLELLSQEDKIRVLAKFHLLEEKGHLLVRPHTDTARNGIRYLRIKKYRIFYFFDKKIIVMVNGYEKKKDALDKNEIQRAEMLRTEYLTTIVSSKI
ncbi:MAG: type II toxin-antitoxin system RelE/ParE family toxin [Elusimicrobia bacterium]|nr:type II toxin-antitoxin system RelE/ParE family toxin [Elusimicrobiota bacterium]